MQKRIVSLLLVLVMLVSLFPAPVRAAETDSNVDSGMTVEGTNGFGNLLSAELQAEYEEETQDTGNYSVLGLEITGNTAKVEYDSMEEAVLVVALYSEDGMQLLTSGKTTVDPTEDIATVTIEGIMPEYFQASAYLVDTYDFSPLCASYDTPMYTREMQELLASTVEDYDADRVLQLDEDKTTNFAVYAEDTILIEEQPGVNTVASVNDETSTYVIENADESITSLREGDIFAYPYGDNEILIVKVASISVSGTTVTITGAEMEMEEAFSHVKIEATGNTADVQVHEEDTVEGVTFEGLVTDGVAPMAVDGSASAEKTLKYTLDKKLKDEGTYGEAEVKVKGSISLKFKLEFSFYVSWRRQFFDLEIETKLKADVSVSGKVAGKIPLPSFGFSPIVGAYIDFDPEVKLEFSGKITYSISISAAISVTYENGKGIKFHFKPKAESKLEIEGSIFLGIDMNPNMEVAGGVLLDTDLSLPIGIKVIPNPIDAVSGTGDSIHSCQKCVPMEVYFEAEAEAKLQFLKWDKLTLEKKFDFKVRVGTAYYSYDDAYFGWGTCPKRAYRVTIHALKSDGSFAKNVEVFVEEESAGKTNSYGILTAYIPDGPRRISATMGTEYISATFIITKPGKITLKAIGSFSSAGGDSFVGGGSSIGRIPVDTTDGNITDDITSGTCGENVTWKMTPDGVLKISGTGPMREMKDDRDAPWYIFREQISRVDIENGVTRIGAWAFQYYRNIVSVSIPDSVTSIGAGAFFGCSKLSGVTIPKGITTIEAFTFCYCDGLTSVKIPDGVTTIRDYAFDRCTNLTSVSIPDSVTSIDEGAFYCCYALDNVTLPRNLITLGDWVFTGCTSLSKITIPNSVTTIGIGTFKVCEKLLSVVIPNSVTSIGDTAFANCDSLTNVTIPDSVTSIGYLVFGYCDRLSSVTIPNSVTSISEGAFSNCGCLTDIYYTGTEDQWNKISISTDNDSLISATVHYNTTGPAAVVEILSAETATEDIPNLDAVYGGEYDTEELEDYTLKTASFTGLVPNEEYLLLALVNLEAEDALAANNLLYIDQAVAGEDGTLTFEYVQRTLTAVSYVMACGASNKNLENAEITFPEMTADGTVHAVDPTVVYEGTTLTEGTDYVLLGDVTYTEAGTYTCFVRGVHRYTGLVTCPYTVTGDSETPPTEDTKPVDPEGGNPTNPEGSNPTNPEGNKPADPESGKPAEPVYDNPFVDVFESDYYYDSVLWAVSKDITKGTDATHFSPEGTCTRAQIVTFLWRANGSPEAGDTNPFTDVPADAWYADAVLWAVAEGITSGTSATTFSPDAGCTRGQVATFLWRSEGQPASGGNNIFTDIDSSAYYYDAILWAVANGITNGVAEGLFAPDATCTRGQIVTFLYRAMA